MQNKPTMTYQIGQTVAYAKKFLKQIKAPATDPSWFRKGIVVAIPDGQPTPLYPHWRTGQAQVLPPNLVLVRWNDVTYPILHEDGEQQLTHAVRPETIAVVGSGRFAEDI